ncbi:MAG: hypothetical protein BGO49_26390 [Planctomycetales bacterium 71-10]|nr:MAG: hypothetical protein BGO49_26390 [Planctomycetales bacterium 71-10]
MPSTLTVGSSADCDVVLTVPSVSGRHCRLSREGDAAFLEDLGSRNGTYVNGTRLEGPARVVVTAADAVHLGSHRLDVGPLLERLADGPAAEDPRLLDFTGDAMVIGRVAGNDLVIDLPTVSSRHARLLRSGEGIFVEDLGSSNGTYVDGRRIAEPTALGPGSILSLGSAPFRLSDASWRPAVVDSFEWRGGPTASPIAPAVAVLIAGTLAAAMAPLAAPAGPARLFALAIAAMAVGAVDALAAAILRPPTGIGRDPAGWRTAGAVATLGLVQAAFLWLPVRGLGGVQGRGVAAVAVVFLAVMAGAAVSFAASRLVPGSRRARSATVAGLVVAAGLLGGFAPAASDLPAAVRPALGISPVRWAFEGLMLAGPSGEGGGPAERYFPAATDRMGLPADCAALALGAFGLAVLAATRRPDGAPAQPSSLTA